MYSGAVELLETLLDRNIPFALVRNTTLPPQEFQQTLNLSGAQKYFSIDKNVILSGDVGNDGYLKILC